MTIDLSRTASAVRTSRDLALLLGRIALAVLMIAHAQLMWELGGHSLTGVGRLFEQGGVPVPALTGPLNLLLELVGGVAILLGLGVGVFGLLLAANMLGAWVLVHPHPLYAPDHSGPETVLAIGALCLVLAAVGSGRFGLAPLVAARSRRAGRTPAD